MKAFCFKMPLGFALQIDSVKDNVPTFATAMTYIMPSSMSLSSWCMPVPVSSLLFCLMQCVHTPQASAGSVQTEEKIKSC